MAGFTPALAQGTRIFEANAHVSARGKNATNVRVTLGARFVPNKGRSWNIRSHGEFKRSRGTRVQEEDGDGCQAEEKRDRNSSHRAHEGLFVAAAAFRISPTIASDRSPPMGKTICKWPAASMISVRKL